MRLRLSALLFGLAALGCGDDPFGLDAARRFDFEAEVPLTLRLPPEDLPPAPIDVRVPLSVRVPFDVVQVLRAEGYVKEAEALAQNKSRLERVELLAVEYEVPYPNLARADLGALAVAIEPVEGGGRVALGRTVPVPAGRAIATREVDYAEGGLAAAGALLGGLSFALAAEGEVAVRAGQGVTAETLVLQLRLHMRFEARLL